MTISRKSMTVMLTGVLVIAAAGALPSPSAFAEGGARRDVVRHAAESKATTMDTLYLVEFGATEAGAPTSREQKIEQLEKLVIPTIESLGRMARSGQEASSPVVSPGPSWLGPSQTMR